MYHYVKHNCGFVLFVVLIYLQIFSVFTLYTLTNSLNANKNSKNIFVRNQLFITAERALTFAENKCRHETPTCILPLITVNDLVQQPVTWWKNKACKGRIQDFHYYYVIEFLGHNPCVLIGNSIANYYRISLLITTLKQYDRVLLQSTVAKPGNSETMCNGQLYQITEGRQSWRKF